MKLTAATLAELLPNEPLARLTCLSLRGRDISHIEDLSRLLPAVKRIDLTDNAIRHHDALSGLRKCSGVTQLVLQGNELTELDWVTWLPKELHVLNVSRNQIKLLPECINECQGLRALMLNHNKLKRVDVLSGLPELNTLVVSHNQIEELPMLDRLPELIKLSAAHNKLRAMPDMRKLLKLRELRLSGNKIHQLSAEQLPVNIRVLDLGDNIIQSWDQLEAIRKVKWLNNLTLKGNPIADRDDYTETIRLWFPRLRVLDGRRIDAKYLERKEEKQREAATTTDPLEKEDTLSELKQEQNEKMDIDDDSDDNDDEPKKGKAKRKRNANDTIRSSSSSSSSTDHSSVLPTKKVKSKRVTVKTTVKPPSEEVIAARKRALLGSKLLRSEHTQKKLKY
ncbi:hypothetical protein BDF22DRAFT_670766 [Syncephalis plumigaleata]|nr:hypothetical protein BDF22DRAFT_670766 [Syncephalis plumigaleata]